MAKEIKVKINILNASKIEKLLTQVLGEIVASRIDNIPIEYRKYVIEEVLRSINTE